MTQTVNGIPLTRYGSRVPALPTRPTPNPAAAMSSTNPTLTPVTRRPNPRPTVTPAPTIRTMIVCLPDNLPEEALTARQLDTCFGVPGALTDCFWATPRLRLWQRRQMIGLRKGHPAACAGGPVGLLDLQGMRHAAAVGAGIRHQIWQHGVHGSRSATPWPVFEARHLANPTSTATRPPPPTSTPNLASTPCAYTPPPIQATANPALGSWRCTRPDRWPTSTTAPRPQWSATRCSPPTGARSPLPATPLLTASPTARPEPVIAPQPLEHWSPSAVEFDRVVPPAGNLQVAGKQFCLGPARSGVTVTLWADTDVIHLLIAGARIKSLRSHLSLADLAALMGQGGRPAGPQPLPPTEQSEAVEVDRTVNRAGSVSLGQHLVLAAEILGGRRVGIRIEAATLSFFDLDTRQLLRTRPSPLTPADISRLRGVRPAGPPPQPATGSVPVQRRASNSGVVMVVGQKVALGRTLAGKTVTIEVTDTDLTIDTPSSAV
ncbi:hypothetical protein [Micromonospora sp. NPDC051006]|uniref:hypothetical protein n=1 Tax=Micromonospora sp. NPDC051006 TaxID=3364283 RepID=UPI00378A956A